MPKGTSDDGIGLLLEGQRPTNLILQRDDGGVWRLGARAAVCALIGKRGESGRAVTEKLECFQRLVRGLPAVQ